MSFLKTPSYQKLKKIGQEDLLKDWDTFTFLQQEELALQIEQLDIKTFFQQKKALLSQPNKKMATLTPFNEFEIAGVNKRKKLGKEAIAAGLVGCLVVAGGQGTRLGHLGPKGTFPVTVVRHKSLFQLLCEKVKAAQAQLHCQLLIAVMTSQSNHKETLSYFIQHRYFGLKPEQLFFFSQSSLPFLTSEGRLFLDSQAKIVCGPDGNGSSLKEFISQGIWSKWYEKGVRYLNYLQIDNALADPFDAELIGYQIESLADVVIKAVKRADPLEKVGVIVKCGSQVEVVEYFELSDKERFALDHQKQLQHPLANISAFSFSMQVVKQVIEQNFADFPLHKSWKTVGETDSKTLFSSKKQAWKFERFIFDLLPFIDKVAALLYPRCQCFAPLKNCSGVDSIETVKTALQAFDCEKFQEITKTAILQNQVFELDPQFYYPTEKLVKQWQGKELPSQPYIDFYT